MTVSDLCVFNNFRFSQQRKDGRVYVQCVLCWLANSGVAWLDWSWTVFKLYDP